MSCSNDDHLVCSFCSKSKDEVRVIICGPRSFICDECVELCADICNERHRHTAGEETPLLINSERVADSLADASPEQLKDLIKVPVQSGHVAKDVFLSLVRVAHVLQKQKISQDQTA